MLDILINMTASCDKDGIIIIWNIDNGTCF